MAAQISVKNSAVYYTWEAYNVSKTHHLKTGKGAGIWWLVETHLIRSFLNLMLQRNKIFTNMKCMKAYKVILFTSKFIVGIVIMLSVIVLNVMTLSVGAPS